MSLAEGDGQYNLPRCRRATGFVYPKGPTFTSSSDCSVQFRPHTRMYLSSSETQPAREGEFCPSMHGVMIEGSLP
jgi:hypothetical protein